MKLAIFLLFASALSGQTLTVMTFNVRYPEPKDGRNYWENRKDLVAETILRHDPDVLGTQELVYSQGDFLDQQLAGYDWFGISRRGNHEDEHMGVFYKRDKLLVIESGNFWLSETPDDPGSMSWDVSLPRMVTWARFRSTAGDEFFFYNTHFPHRREDAAARLEAAKVLVADIEKRVPKGASVILAGDFNSAADSDVHDVLTKPLQDAWVVAKQTSGPATTSSRWTGATEGRRIDWILFRGPWTTVRAAVIDDNDEGRYPSDHYPVLAVFEPRSRNSDR